MTEGKDLALLTEAQQAYLNGETVIEIGRQFVAPLAAEDVLPIKWNLDRAADLSESPPKINGHEMRWVKRTVVYGPWEDA